VTSTTRRAPSTPPHRPKSIPPLSSFFFFSSGGRPSFGGRGDVRVGFPFFYYSFGQYGREFFPRIPGGGRGFETGTPPSFLVLWKGMGEFFFFPSFFSFSRKRWGPRSLGLLSFLFREKSYLPFSPFSPLTVMIRFLPPHWELDRRLSLFFTRPEVFSPSVFLPPKVFSVSLFFSSVRVRILSFSAGRMMEVTFLFPPRLRTSSHPLSPPLRR